MPRAARKQTGVNDFTGGLNLGPPQEIAVNEVAFARDVVFSSRGGVASRPGFRPFSGEQLGGDNDVVQVLTHIHYRQADSTFQLFGNQVGSGEMHWTEGGLWFPTGIDPGVTITGTETTSRTIVGVNAAQYLDRSYFVKTDAVASVMWDGYTATTLGTGWNNDLADVTVQNMPVSYLIAVKGDFTFVAHTIESSTNQRNRLRWSHPGFPTAWREEDFVDLPAPITAIVPFRDFLAIFTNENIYGLYGASTETFQIQEISATSGTPFHWCVTQSQSTLYWWDWDSGVMAMGAGAPRPVMGGIKPFFDRGGFIADRYDTRDAVYPPPNLLWGEGKLYVKTGGPLNPTTHPQGLGTIFVYDPSIGREGVWTTYSGGTSSNGLALYPRATKNDLVVAGDFAHPMVLNDYSQVLDRNFLYDASDKIAPNSVVRTAPFEGETNATKKRWSRPRVAIRSSSSRQVIQFGYLKNYFEGDVSTFHEIDLDFTSLAADPLAVYSGDAWTDEFPSIDTVRWNASSASVTAAGTLNLEVTAAGATQTLTTDWTAYNMTDSRVRAQLVTAPTGTATTSLLIFAGNRNARWRISGSGAMTAGWRDEAAVTTTVYTTTFNAAVNDWVRIREDSGQLVFEYSADGVTWTVAHTMDWPWDDRTPEDGWTFQIESTVPGAGTQTHQWDNFEFAPEGGAIYDSDDYAELADNLGVGLPDNNIRFETLPSAGAGNVFQIEFKWKTTNGAALSYRHTNGAWGIDSIVLPYREKGLR
jgi:hypothetical protein